MGIGAPGMDEFPDGDAEDAGPLVPCPDCGRSFAADRLERHMKICKKVFQQKRKKFDSAANRLGELENAKQLVANAHKLEKEKEKKADSGGGQDSKAQEVQKQRRAQKDLGGAHRGRRHGRVLPEG